VAGIAGATILGDGTVALIIDAPGLISSAAKQGVGAVAAHAA
jgi:chemotaxis protein histidine kinase CheA